MRKRTVVGRVRAQGVEHEILQVMETVARTSANSRSPGERRAVGVRSGQAVCNVLQNVEYIPYSWVRRTGVPQWCAVSRAKNVPPPTRVSCTGRQARWKAPQKKEQHAREASHCHLSRDSRKDRTGSLRIADVVQDAPAARCSTNSYLEDPCPIDSP